MVEHRLTLYESFVRETPVVPAEDNVALEADGASVVHDHGDDLDGHWYGCTCGDIFHDERQAWDHSMEHRSDGGEAA
jgi:hypothetical protein